jgi:hypothetical protein
MSSCLCNAGDHMLDNSVGFDDTIATTYYLFLNQNKRFYLKFHLCSLKINIQFTTTHSSLGRVNMRGNIIFLDFKKAHMFKCKIYMYRN